MEDLRSPGVGQRSETLPRKAKNMIGQAAAGIQPDGFRREMGPVATGLANTGEEASLIVDGTGRVRSCGASGERMFGASPDGLVGRRISDFIAGLHLGGSSPSYAARYLVFLCGEGEWREFEGVNAAGRRFAVELSLSRIVADGQEAFRLNVRRPAKARGVV